MIIFFIRRTQILKRKKKNIIKSKTEIIVLNYIIFATI